MKHQFQITIATLILIIMSTAIVKCQTVIDTAASRKVTEWINRQDKKVIHFGFSIGTRSGFNSEKESRAIATILPDTTHNVNIEYRDRLAFLLSTSMTAFPFPSHTLMHNWGFTANINLVELADDKLGTVFNKSIDGGFGFAYAFDKERQFAVGLTYERTSTRRPKKWVIENEGKPIVVAGSPVSEINASDDQYYIDTGLNAWSLKFIYEFK